MIGRSAASIVTIATLVAAIGAVRAAGDGPAFEIDPGTPTDITCDSKAVVVAEGAPGATHGGVQIRLEATPADVDARRRWTPLSVADGHAGAFAARERNACASGCPLTVATNGEIQLWSPAARSLDSLKEGETLLLAVIRRDGALRASTFRGRGIEALEEGACRKITP